MHAVNRKLADKLITPLVLILGATLAMGFIATSAAAAGVKNFI